MLHLDVSGHKPESNICNTGWGRYQENTINPAEVNWHLMPHPLPMFIPCKFDTILLVAFVDPEALFLQLPRFEYLHCPLCVVEIGKEACLCIRRRGSNRRNFLSFGPLLFFTCIIMSPEGSSLHKLLGEFGIPKEPPLI